MNRTLQISPINDESLEYSRASVVEGWKLWECRLVGSTNLMAEALGAWEAVRADRQTAGRGRFQREWISDEGGLWLSAVVTTDLAGHARRTLPIIAGLAVCCSLQTLGVQSLRMRWPNDVLVDDRKLAGLLIDQFAPSLAVIGIDINVNNHPETLNASLKDQTARLADLLPDGPSIAALTALILRNLKLAVGELAVSDFRTLPARVNELWGPPRRVELDLDGETRRGIFQGIDTEGRLILADENGGNDVFDPWQVRHLKEI